MNDKIVMLMEFDNVRAVKLLIDNTDKVPVSTDSPSIKIICNVGVANIDKFGVRQMETVYSVVPNLNLW